MIVHDFSDGLIKIVRFYIVENYINLGLQT
jgi:hypothetical protein